MHETIDIERCVWDLDYRRMVMGLLNAQLPDPKDAANQNRRPADQDRAPRSH